LSYPGEEIPEISRQPSLEPLSSLDREGRGKEASEDKDRVDMEAKDRADSEDKGKVDLEDSRVVKAAGEVRADSKAVRVAGEVKEDRAVNGADESNPITNNLNYPNQDN